MHDSKLSSIASREILLTENTDLRSRLSAIEIEREDLYRQVNEMFILQQIFSTINSTIELDDILATVLRGVREAIGFERVVLFEVSDYGVSRHLETNSVGDIVSGFGSPSPIKTASFDLIISGKEAIQFGSNDDGPVEGDVGAGWCMAALTYREEIRGILYADRPRTVEIGENQIRMLLEFAIQAAIAIENGRLFRETNRLLDESRRLALTDALTGLANRRALEEAIDREIANVDRKQGSTAVMLLDLDDLKGINDREGHHGGDLALQRLSATLRASARRSDMVGRWAGDEFVLLLSESDYAQAGLAADRLFEAFQSAGVRVTAGVAVFPAHGRTTRDLISSADRGLYAAKRAGKNRWMYGGIGPTN